VAGKTPSFLLEGVHFSLDAERMRITLAWLQNRKTGRGVWVPVRGSARLLMALEGHRKGGEDAGARGFPAPGEQQGQRRAGGFSVFWCLTRHVIGVFHMAATTGCSWLFLRKWYTLVQYYTLRLCLSFSRHAAVDT